MEPPISFFLPGPAGNLFAMYYPPAETEIDNGDVLYVHPFAGEMFASRNVIAACARDLAAAGTGVLTVDLYGCGDSSGDFSDARWELWRGDVAAAAQWLQQQGRDRLSLWGLRLGALLAMDFAAQSRESYERIVLWQPVVNGRNMLTQFFRMNLDEADKDEADNERFAGRLTNPEERGLLADNEKIEVAGYGVAPALIRTIDKLDIASLGNSISAPICWMEFAEKAGHPFHPDSLRVMEAWNRQGVQVTTHKTVASPFWLFPHCVDPKRLTKDLTLLFRDAGALSREQLAGNH